MLSVDEAWESDSSMTVLLYLDGPSIFKVADDDVIIPFQANGVLFTHRWNIRPRNGPVLNHIMWKQLILIMDTSHTTEASATACMRDTCTYLYCTTVKHAFSII